MTQITRAWAMPDMETFNVPPIRDFVGRYLRKSVVSVDPFARNRRWCTWSNDILPSTKAEYHLDAVDFLKMLVERGVEADLVILDPPYSPRQISECYQELGRKVTMTDTQNSVLYERVRWAVERILTPFGVVLSFGWNTCGMGKSRGYEILEILMVCHGAAQNDTLCMAEKRRCHSLFESNGNDKRPIN